MDEQRLEKLIASIHFDPPAIDRTQWTLIEKGQGDEDSRVIYCYSQEQLDHELAHCFHMGGVIVELFIDRQRLTDQERADFIAEANRADEDRHAGR